MFVDNLQLKDIYEQNFMSQRILGEIIEILDVMNFIKYVFVLEKNFEKIEECNILELENVGGGGFYKVF